MAEIALPRQCPTQTPQSSAVGSPLYQRQEPSNSGTFELVPNPDFTFPMRPDAASEPTFTPSLRPMSLQAYPAGRRGSAPGPRQKSVSALPDFSFNPAGSSKTSPARLSPPHSPTAASSTPARPMGHRRGGSEFIGGDGRTGGATLLSSSPTRGDSFAPPPSATLRPGPPGGRRGHAHRRSGAISSHDLSAIMRPPESGSQTKAGSAPVTPLDGEQSKFGHSVNKSLSQPSLRENVLASQDSDQFPLRPVARTRVGFSDKVEYIRPLSTISSETETSMSTIRGHSATGSLSSIVSAGTTTPPRFNRPSLNTMPENERPSTAGAILDMSPRKSPHFGGDLFNRKRPSSAISPTSPTVSASPPPLREPAKRRGFFRLETRRSDSSVPRLSTCASDPALSTTAAVSVPSPQTDDADTSSAEKRKCSSRKMGKKPRKVKSWANNIISRKGKHSGKAKVRAPTPPATTANDMDETSESEDWEFEANFDVDTTVTIVSEAEVNNARPRIDTDFASWKPRHVQHDEKHATSPIIDLDAALGPFNTPQGSSPRGAQRGFGAHRRALHSAGGMVLNHRRTESAPALVPFELRTSPMGKSSMADVFEEEEPDEEPTHPNESSAANTPVQKPEPEHPKVHLVESEGVATGSAINWNFPDGLGIKRGEKSQRTEAAVPSPPLSPLAAPSSAGLPEVDSRTPLESSPVEVVEDYEEPRTSSLTHSSESTVTPQLTAEDAKHAHPVMTLPLPLPQNSLATPDTFTSSFSSPDFRSSQASFDTPRLGTAASSVTDYRTLPSPHFGEPGPELRISVDDVPSLTSSRSTMTSGVPHGFPLASPRRPSERSTSLCSVTSELESRRRKRSSIASLSRLINGSPFAEKSKLSIEQRPHSDYIEPSKEAKKKHNRLSKLKFWRPKDSSGA
ncbi:hypothetical protein M011DRAFT_336435 [Sporormia fimetaria CBS 119925]|uniref:Cell wall proline rich protein n=1 Tax=Sporormia fimetaria CBS 119925 TaxID=1340428 RepID=A0A6A6VDU9_9PLEO|nr:hypothetical protein M011DRAFT_336435 [Sporormia fimetaria CBS 119925]